VANELLQNALEHGLAGRNEGKIVVNLADKDEHLKLSVADNGHGLPPGFNAETDLGLGLNIVRTSVIEDMKGQFRIGQAKSGIGTLVQITVPTK
jgi:two-component sensor histidine kinase